MIFLGELTHDLTYLLPEAQPLTTTVDGDSRLFSSTRAGDVPGRSFFFCFLAVDGVGSSWSPSPRPRRSSPGRRCPPSTAAPPTTSSWTCVAVANQLSPHALVSPLSRARPSKAPSSHRWPPLSSGQSTPSSPSSGSSS